MAPSLQAIVNYAAQYGFKIDKQTLSLINQAKKLGLVKDAQKDIGTVTAEGFKAVCLVLDKIVLALGDVVKAIKGINDQADDFTDEGKRAGDKWKDAGERARKAWDWVDRGDGRGPGDRQPDASHFASGGIAWAPQLAHIAERGPEIIMPLRDYRADAIPSTGGRSRAVNLTFNVNAIDRAGIETFLRRDARPILQRMLDHNDFNVPVGAVGGP
jgi:hypothetical protein